MDRLLVVGVPKLRVLFFSGGILANLLRTIPAAPRILLINGVPHSSRSHALAVVRFPAGGTKGRFPILYRKAHACNESSCISWQRHVTFHFYPRSMLSVTLHKRCSSLTLFVSYKLHNLPPFGVRRFDRIPSLRCYILPYYCHSPMEPCR